jgi:hypothetical protein
MFVEFDKTANQIADEIVNEFQRLGVSTDENPYSGLMAEVPNTETYLVKVYDDYASGIYQAEPLLKHLKALSETTFEDIWQEIAAFQV